MSAKLKSPHRRKIPQPPPRPAPRVLKPAQIEAASHRVAESIRQYCVSQLESWRRIPWLALQADGRNGYSGELPLAYARGAWVLQVEFANVGRIIAVDCASGRLINITRLVSKNELVDMDDQSILKLVAHLDTIDAAEIVKYLQWRAAEPYARGFDGEGADKWRLDTMVKHKPEQRYVRKRAK